jgi:hypothetical protein
MKILFVNPSKLYDGERTRPCLRDRLWCSLTHPSVGPILGVGLLCKSDDPQRHLCLEVTMPNPICDICHKPVKLETSKTNELGKAVHEGCYLLRVRAKKATSPRKA